MPSAAASFMRRALFTRPIVAFIGLFAGLAIGICVAELADSERIAYWSRAAAQAQQLYNENQQLHEQLKQIGAGLNESQPGQAPPHHQSRTTEQ